MAYPSAPTYPAQPAGATATQPTLTVTGRADGEAYTVTAGARSLSITAQSGATLLTTVEQASTGASVPVTGATTSSPLWTAPSGTTVGEACNVLTVATLDGLTSHVGWTEYTAGSGGGGGSGASWATVKDIDATTVTNAGPHTSGTNTYTFGSDTIDVTATRNSSAGDVEAVNGTGVVVTDAGGTMTSAWAITDVISGFDREYLLSAPLAIHFVLSVNNSTSSTNGPAVGVNKTTTHNSGNFRGMWGQWASASTENRKYRVNASNTTWDTITPRTNRVITAIITGGEIVELMDTDGTTPPTPSPGGTAEMIGSNAVGVNDSAATYENLYFIVNAAFNCDITVTRILVQRWE